MQTSDRIEEIIREHNEEQKALITLRMKGAIYATTGISISDQQVHELIESLEILGVDVVLNNDELEEGREEEAPTTLGDLLKSALTDQVN